MFLSNRLGSHALTEAGAAWVPGGAWAPLLLALLSIAAFWRSFLAVAPLLGADSPLGLAPVVPVLAAWLAVVSVRRRAAAGQRLVGEREPALDLPAAAILLGTAAWLMWISPGRDGWYFWAKRLDLLAAPLFALGVATLLWGVQTLWWHRLAALYALLVWPAFLVWAQQWSAEPAALMTAALARPIALAAGVHLAPVDLDPRQFIGTGPIPFNLLVGDVCAGLNAGLAVALISVPGAVQLGIPARRAALWAMAGIALALISNVVRVAGLLFVADRYGPQVAMGTVHPLLGAALLTLVFAALWWSASVARGGAGGAPLGTGPGSVQGSVQGSAHAPAAPVSTRLGIVIVGVAALFAVASGRLAVFEPLPPVGPPGGDVSAPIDALHLPPGWRLQSYGELAVQNLFGTESHSYWLELLGPDGQRVPGQLITTPDRSRLRTYGVEECRIFHGADVVGTRSVALRAGGSATLIDTWENRGDPSLEQRLSLVYWEAPFLLNGRETHARTVLYLPQREQGTLPPAPVNGLAPGGAIFDAADGKLLELANGITGSTIAQVA